MTSGASATNSAAYLRMSVGIARAPASIDAHVAAVGPAQLLQPLQERRDAGLRIADRPRRELDEHADAPHPLALLRARRERPRRRRTAEKRDELAPPHSITSSARASRDGGTVRPSILAVSVLMTNSNLVDCATGRSAGLVPLRMRPA